MSNDFGKHLSGRMHRINPRNIPKVTGSIVWYKRENYERCLAIFDDADELHDTFDDWLVSAKELEKQLSDRGMKVIRAEIDPDTFPQWCTDQGHTTIDRKARLAYGNFVAMQHLAQPPSD